MLLMKHNLSRGSGFTFTYDNVDYTVRLLTYRDLEGFADVMFEDLTHDNNYFVRGGRIELNGHVFTFKFTDDFRPERLNYIPMTNQFTVEVDQ